MNIEVKTPALPESVADGVVASWHKKPGERVRRDEPLVDIETDKVVLEVPAPADGILTKIIADEGATVTSEAPLGLVEDDSEGDHPEAPTSPQKTAEEVAPPAGPAARQAMQAAGIDPHEVRGSGRHGRILTEDVRAMAQADDSPAEMAESDEETATGAPSGREEQRVPMSRLRRRIAERLLEVTQTTAMLTTFNEINMQPLMDLRSRYRELFEQTHHTRLGFMSMFVKAACVALQRFPEVNASIDGDDIVYHSYCDIGIAVSSPRGLVVPVLRDAQWMSMATIESSIASFATKARDGKIGVEELRGGTFTITNGGVFGSLFSTPILNPPQSAILGMHAIQKRVVVEDDEMVIRPMMYVALSYDHRIIDGKSAVHFLRTIKALVEDPGRMLLEV